MTNADWDQQLGARYPFWGALPPQARRLALSSARCLDFPDGAPLFTEGQQRQGFPCVLEGQVRVFKSSPTGRELLLYRITPGEACIISCHTLIRRCRYEARAVTQGRTQLLLLSEAAFDDLLGHAPFRHYVLDNFADRLGTLMALVEEVAFRRLDERLASLLLHNEGGLVHRTHQQLADELGSVRVIVSRLLNGFADQGLVRLGRESIDLLDREGLARIAQGTT
jgi:CRP/FNR family transcriptional regulator